MTHRGPVPAKGETAERIRDPGPAGSPRSMARRVLLTERDAAWLRPFPACAALEGGSDRHWAAFVADPYPSDAGTFKGSAETMPAARAGI
jgi:hypothetical protein